MPSSLGPLQLPEPGGKRADFFTFDDPELGAYRWPYFAVVGPEPGLKFLLTAGVHAALEEPGHIEQRHHRRAAAAQCARVLRAQRVRQPGRWPEPQPRVPRPRRRYLERALRPPPPERPGRALRP